MLRSSGSQSDAERCKAAGINSYLHKPIRRSELYAALMGASGKTIPSQGKLEVAPPGIGVPGRGLRILLAEDNRVNQELAARLLAKLGHSSVIANNGLEALALLATEVFDLVLMDIQMPEMDGIAATQQIRERETFTGAHMPIIAMTAHALKGDRQRCLDAGMDGYVSKPISAKDLQAAILSLLPLEALT
jgi:CheY-like chemotaxis protein